MGFFETILKQKQVEKTVIPETSKSVIEGIDNFASMPQFRVEGIYSLADQIMVSGKVIAGSFKKGLKLKDGKKEMHVVEVQSKFRNSDILNKGDRGALYLKTKGLIIRIGDTLKFG